MMAPWQTLGVEPDANKKDIKRAYASLAKQFRPDESPGDFQRIREAYEAMLALLQHSQSSGQQPQSQDSVERQNIVNLLWRGWQNPPALTPKHPTAQTQPPRILIILSIGLNS